MCGRKPGWYDGGDVQVGGGSGCKSCCRRSGGKRIMGGSCRLLASNGGKAIWECSKVSGERAAGHSRGRDEMPLIGSTITDQFHHKRRNAHRARKTINRQGNGRSIFCKYSRKKTSHNASQSNRAILLALPPFPPPFLRLISNQSNNLPTLFPLPPTQNPPPKPPFLHPTFRQ